MDQALSKFFEQGILGVVTAMALIALAYLYRQNRIDRDKHAAELKAERDRHEDSRAEWQERYIASRDTSVKQISEMAAATREVLASLARKYEREEDVA